jgi:hypothetical protein
VAVYYTEQFREVANVADRAATLTIAGYRDQTLPYETNITDGLALSLRTALHGQIGGLDWSAHVMKSARGAAAEESETGADLLIHVAFSSPEVSYSKGVLIQAKRVEPRRLMQTEAHRELVAQCRKMLSITAASFVFDYTLQGVRCGAASVIMDSNNRSLYDLCIWTPHRFFFELFRCHIGDPSITSARAKDLPVPNKLFLEARGEGMSTGRRN